MNKKVIKDLNENGYSILKSFFSKKIIKETLKSYENNIDYCMQLLDIKAKGNIDKKYLLLQKKNKKIKSRSYDISKFHPSLSKLSINPKMLKIIKNIFNETFFIDFPQIRADDNKNSFILPLHQEIYGQLSSRVITLWCPLTPTSKKNGTLNLIQGSHKNGLLKHQNHKIKSKKYHGVKKKLIKNANIKSLKLNAGDVVLFDPHLIHGSGKNFSKKIRWTFIVRYNAISGIEYLRNIKAPLRIIQKIN